MTEVRVLIADAMDPRAAAVFQERGILVDEQPGLSPDELASIISSWPAGEAADTLIDAVLARGAPDNVSLIITKVV